MEFRYLDDNKQQMFANRSSDLNISTDYLCKPKIINSISQLCTNAMNKSFQYNSDSDNSLNNQELLQMELKQLRRENVFLKKKIEQLKTTHIIPPPKVSKRNSLNYMKLLKHRSSQSNVSQKNQNTYSYVIKQVQNILKSLAMVHRIQVDDSLFLQNSFKNNERYNNEKQFISKQNEINMKINKKLQRLSLESQQKRYASLLMIFTEFYKYKKQTEIYIKDRLNSYIEQTLSISKDLFDKITAKIQQKNLARSSGIFSNQSYMDDQLKTSLVDMSNDLRESITLDSWKRSDREKYHISFSTIRNNKKQIQQLNQ